MKKLFPIILAFLAITFSGCKKDSYDPTTDPSIWQVTVVDFEFDVYKNMVTFTNTSDEELGNNQFLWDFGDGSTHAYRNAVHTYEANGTYTVKLTALLPMNTTKSVSKKVTIDYYK